MSALRQLAEQTTPPPWVMVSDETDVCVVYDGDDFETGNAPGAVVCTLVEWTDADPVRASSIYETDARLIALAPEMASLLADAMAWIDESMHSADDDLDTGHALLARFAVLERRAANPADGAT